jgi:uncharacterized protein (TIGR03435 family)
LILGQVPAKPTFEVVSIKPVGEFDVGRVGGYGINAVGYYAKGMPLWMTVVAAYFPPERMNRPLQTPGWPPMMNKDAYDIEAKFDAPTAAAWKHMTTDQQWKMIQPMLQTMLADRCKLKAHMTMVNQPAYELVVAKRGPRLKETAPGATAPDHALPIGSDAMMANYLYRSDLKIPPWAEKSPFKDHFVFFRTSMPVLAAWLSHMGLGRQVVDHTGLTGKYDFVVPQQVRGQEPVPAAPGEASDPAGTPPRWVFDLSGLGLELRPTKAPEPTLAIDHIEKPTPN